MPRRLLLLLVLSGAFPALVGQPEPETDAGAETPTESPEDGGEAPAGGPVRRLDTIVVIGRQLEEEAFDSPATVEFLDADEISHGKAYRTFPQALREIPGIAVQKTGPGQLSPFIRGFTGFHTLLLIDGIRLNHAVLRSGPNQYWNTVDPLTIERVEVLKGTASVLYGSDAIGGAVNVITRSPEFGGNPFDGGGRLYYRYASGEQSHIGRVEGQGSYAETAGVLAGISYKGFGSIISGGDSGELPHTNYDELDGDAKVVAFPQDDLELVIAVQDVDQDDVPRTHSTIFSESFHGTTIGTDLRRDFDQDRTLVYLQAHWRPEDVEWLSRLSVSFSYHRHAEEEERVRSNLRMRNQGFIDEVAGTFLALESPSPIGVLSYGVEFYHDDVDSFFSELNPDGTLREWRSRGPVADEAEYDLLAAYIQDTFQITERFDISAGGRFTWARAEAGEVDPDPTDATAFGPVSEDFYSAVGSIRGVFHATDDWNLFAGAFQGFRAPNLADLTRFDASRSGEIEIPAPDLDPEEFVSFEIGSKLRLDCFEAFAAYYYTIIDGMILRFPTGDMIGGDPVVTKANVGDGFVHGVELGASWNFWKGFSAFGSFAWLEGRVENFVSGGGKEDEPLSKMPPAAAILGLRWDSADRRWWAEGTVRMADGQDRLSERDEADTQRIPPEGTPGYTIYSIRAGTRVWDGFVVFAAIENITDKEFRVHGSGQNEPGVSAIAGVDWRF